MKQVLALDAENAEALALLGVCLLLRDEAAQAVPVLERACSSLVGMAWPVAHLAEAYERCGELSAAFDAYERATRLDAGNVAYALGAVGVLARQGRHDEAAARLEGLLRSDPGNPLIWYNLGTVRRDQGLADAALRCFSVALSSAPDWVDARNSRASLLHAAFDFDEAEREYRRCIEQAPDHVAYRLNLASLLIDCGRFQEAEAWCREIVSRWPAETLGHKFLASALDHQGKLLQALQQQEIASTLAGDDANCAESLAFALAKVGRYDDAWPQFERAIRLAPDVPSARHARSLSLLACGRIADGWREYDCRPSARGAGIIRGGHAGLPGDATPIWLRSEQGLGDELFFLRFARELRAAGREVVYWPSARLRAFLKAHAEPVAEFSSDGPGVADYSMLIGDLPYALNRDGLAGRSVAGAGTAPAVAAAYPAPLRLTPDPRRLAEMSARLRAFGPPPYTAITWRSGVPPREQRDDWSLYKTVPTAPLAACLRDLPGTLIGIQRNPEPGERERFETELGRPLHDFCDLNEDLAAMLALLAAADEYVCVSNTNTHIRAGTGRSARVLVPGPAEWRWPLGSPVSPWFPQFRAYHQGLDGDWTSALEELRADLYR